MNIPQSMIELSKRAFSGISFDPERRGERFITDMKDSLKAYSEVFGEFYNEEKILSLYNSILVAQSSCYSVMITGGANFNNSRHEKANNRLRKTYKDMDDYIEKVHKAIIRKKNKDVVEAAGGELEMNKAKLDLLKDKQELMKLGNKIYKKKPAGLSQEKVEQLMESGLTVKMIENLPFQTWALTNNNAKIKNTQARILELSAKENAVNTSWISTHDGIEVEITVDYDLDRIIIRHESRPPKESISFLKSIALKWSPTNQGWQRKITNNALYAIKRAFKEEV